MAKSRFIDDQGRTIHEDLSDTTATAHTFLESVIINQAADDDAILQLKSSDIAHAVTSVTETDTYGQLLKASAADGGLKIEGLADAGGTGVHIRGINVTASAEKATTAIANVMIESALKSTSVVAASGADANLCCIRDNGTTRFIFDAEGTLHSDVANTTFDRYNDLVLLDALDYEFSSRVGDPIKTSFGEFLAEAKDALQKEKIISLDGPRIFVNWMKLSMLHTGAIRQVGNALAALGQKVGVLENENKQLKEQLKLK